MRFGAQVWISMPFLGLLGVCGTEKGHAFWSKSVDFYALFGVLGGGRGVEKGQAVRGFRTGMKKIVV